MTDQTEGAKPHYRRGAPSYQVKGGQRKLTLNVPPGVAYIIEEACDREEIGPSEFIRRLVTWYAADAGRCDEFFAERAAAMRAFSADLFPGWPTSPVSLADVARRELENLEALYGQGQSFLGRPIPEDIKEEHRILRDTLQSARAINRKLLDPTTAPEEAQLLREESEAVWSEIDARRASAAAAREEARGALKTALRGPDAPIEKEVDIATHA